jgi:hypothetical protein
LTAANFFRTSFLFVCIGQTKMCTRPNLAEAVSIIKVFPLAVAQ